jgi:hypothetical protein
MNKRQPLQAIIWYFILTVSLATILSLVACIPGPGSSYHQENPGMYGLTGWFGQDAWYNRDRQINIAGGVDINGEVGHPLYVGGPRARCTGPGGSNPGWSASHRVTSGELPPGIDFESNSSGLQGIPTERGHWIVQLELDNVTCNGTTYAGVTQELRFHISGTGRVHD